MYFLTVYMYNVSVKERCFFVESSTNVVFFRHVLLFKHGSLNLHDWRNAVKCINNAYAFLKSNVDNFINLRCANTYTITDKQLSKTTSLNLNSNLFMPLTL